MSTPGDISQYLRELHEQYVDKVNRVLEEGQEDLARELADAYTDEALRAIAASETP